MSSTKKGGKIEITDAQLQASLTRFAAVADLSRLKILRALSGGEMHVGAITAELNTTQPAVSHHLAVLRLSGFVESQRRAKNNFYTLTDLGAAMTQALPAFCVV